MKLREAMTNENMRRIEDSKTGFILVHAPQLNNSTTTNMNCKSYWPAPQMCPWHHTIEMMTV